MCVHAFKFNFINIIYREYIFTYLTCFGTLSILGKRLTHTNILLSKLVKVYKLSPKI